MGDSKEMFCPECGREQSVEGQQFCSGCGRSLVWVAERLRGEPQDSFERAWSGPVRKYSQKQGLKLGILIFTIGNCALAPLGAVLAADILAPIFAVLGFGGAISVIAYSLMFLPKDSEMVESTPRNTFTKMAGDARGIVGKVSDSVKQKIGGRIHDTADQNETRPVGYVPPIGDWRDIEYPQPPSVTDSTTKLLAEEEEKKNNQ